MPYAHRFPISRRNLLATALAAGVLQARPAFAASFPERPIRIVAAYPPGGSADILARLVATHLTTEFGWQVIVENKPGASGITGTVGVARAAPDGYTLVLGSGATHGSFASLYPNLAYHPLRDFAPITNLASLSSVLVTHPSVPVRSVAELIQYAKANPGKLAFGSGGNGSNAHLAMEMFNHMAGVRMLHVPYKGNPPALQDLIAGQVQVMVANTPSVMPFLQPGAARLVALAQAGATRSPALPALPTIAESGLAGYNADVWQGLLAPAGTPPDVVATLNGAVRKIMRLPAVLAALEKMGAVPVDNSPAEFTAQIRDDIRTYEKLVRSIGLTLE
ncbi:MAG TPA: tripartite tricarboxylate transporter substrate binding protein [Ramlibacter sp.]|nr:tripartite tricarboxylate transporter substrate binding protein [Ramlibacter sp.]